MSTLDLKKPKTTAAQPTTVRTVRFEVAWPGWRKQDLQALWKELWKAQDDLRRASNQTVSALWQVRSGALPHPLKTDGKKWPLQTLAYQALSGKWQPFGEPIYVPTTPRGVSSSVRRELASAIHTRVETDWLDVVRGNKVLPTFRSVPLGNSGNNVKLDPDALDVSLTVWAGRRGNRVRIRPRRLDNRQRALIRKSDGYGCAKLAWHKPKGRKGKWMLSLALNVRTKADERAQGTRIAATHLGMINTVTLATATKSDGKADKRIRTAQLPASAVRQITRLQRERTSRSQTNRKAFARRQGRGRQRKLRVVEAIGDRVHRITDTAVRQVAAAIVNMAVETGCSHLVIEDLKNWSVEKALRESQDLPGGGRAARRRWYFQWHQGALRQHLTAAALREGLSIIEVDPAYNSRTCHSCNTLWPELGGEHGRVSTRQFRCTCGVSIDADANAVRNNLKRGLQGLEEG